MMRRRRIVLFVSLAALTTAAAFVAGVASGSDDVPSARTRTALPGFSSAVFLSHPNDPATSPVFPGDPAFRLRTVFTVPRDGFYMRYVQEGEHTGTHYSAPCHFHTGARCAGQLSAGDFILPAIKIDIRNKVADNVDYEVTISDLRRWERRHGGMPSDAAVLLETGCDRFWGPRIAPDEPTYYNCGSAAGKYRQPGFAKAAVKWLIERGVLGRRGALGTDTFGPDPGTDPKFVETWLTLRRHRFTLENLTNLSEVPARGSWIVIGGPRNQRGSGAPSSIIALIP